MSQPPNNRPARYHIFVLSLWEAGSDIPGGAMTWRGSLEHGVTGERRGFKSLAELLSYLELWTQNPIGNESTSNKEIEP